MATELSGEPQYAAEDVVHDVLQQARLDSTISLDNYFLQDMEQAGGLSPAPRPMEPFGYGKPMKSDFLSAGLTLL